MKLGLVLGRFQPLHLGHITLFERAFAENDLVVICIGSAQKADPLPIEERHRRVEEQLHILQRTNYSLVDLIDPIPMNIWPQYVTEKCGITKHTQNTFYRADNDLTTEQKTELEESGYTICIVHRNAFWYRAPNGLYYKISSATEIKQIHKELGMMDLL